MRYLLLIIFFPFLCEAQDISGKWVGHLTQQNKSFTFKLTLEFIHTGEVVSGTCKIEHPTTSNFVIQQFKGDLVNNRITFKEFKVTDSSEPGDWFWCIKEFRGMLFTDNEWRILGEWNGTGKLFGSDQYVDGNCSPGIFKLEIAPPKVLLTGTVYDIRTGHGIQSTINVIRQGQYETDEKGNYSIEVPTNEVFNLVISKKNYRDYISILNIDFDHLKKNFYLEQKHLDIRENQRVNLSNVLFKRQQDVLLEESYAQLDELCGYLLENDSKNIILEGHTDGIGNSKSNMRLSVLRTEAIKEYLIGKGVSKKRISTKGFGDTKIICSPPCSDNRRVEFIISN